LGGCTALAEIGPSPLGPAVLKPGLHLPVGQFQLERQVTPFLGRQVLGAGESTFEIFGLLGCEPDLATFSLHSEVGHVETGRRIGVTVEGGGSGGWIWKSWKG